MIQKKEGEVEFLWRESDYDQKTHLEKKYIVYFWNVAFHQHQEQTVRKIN